MGLIREETIKQFREAVKEEYGRDISTQEASEILYGIANYLHILGRIDRRIADSG